IRRDSTERDTARRHGSAPALRLRGQAGGASAAPLPRSAPHLRDDRGQRRPERTRATGVEGHADLKTTARYLHYRARGDEAGRLAEAFKTATPTASALQANDPSTPAAAFPTAAPAEAETV